MLSAISKQYHPSIGKSVTSFMVGRREKASYLPALQNDAIGPGCVKSRTDAMILFLNRQAGATDVSLCGRD
jgi:hypothetical protein